MNRRLLCVLFAAFLAIASFPVGAEDAGRSTLFQAGIGLYAPLYPAATEDLISYLDSTPGVTRIKVSLDLVGGFAVSEEAMIVARIDGCGDRLDDGIDYIQLNMYLLALGLRYYPSITGFYLEAGAGASRSVAMTSAGNSGSDLGLGYAASIGYDFNSSPRGFGLALEGRYMGLMIEGELVSTLSLSANLCWK